MRIWLGASLLFLSITAACSGGSSSGTDTTLRLVDRFGRPAVGVEVVFHRADGTIVSHLTTSSNGTATAALPDGGGFTFLYLTPDPFRVAYSELGLASGETYVRGVVAADPIPTPLGTASISLAGPVAGASTYQVSAGCGIATASTAAATSLTIAADCDDDGNSAVTLVASAQNSAGTRIAYSVDENVSIPTLTASPRTMPAWRTDMVSYSVTSSDPAASLTRFRISLVGGDGPFMSGQTETISEADSLVFTMARTTPLDVLREMTEFSDGVRTVRLRGAVTSTNETIDLATRLARIDSIAPNGPCVDYAAPASLETEADVMYVNYGFYDSGGIEHEWFMRIRPSAGGNVCLPELPPALSDWLVPAAFNVGFGFADYAAISGWDDYTTAPNPGLYAGRRTTSRGATVP